jgi:hypothetical protein
MLAEELNNKWKPVLEHSDLPEITDSHKRLVTATVLENTERALREASGQGSSQQMLGEGDGHVNSVGSGQVANFDPVLISLVRRSMPNLIAYDVCGVQPMNGPTGLIFAMRSQYANSTDPTVAEAFYNEANTGHASRLGAGLNAANTGAGSATAVGANTVGTAPDSSNNAGNSFYNYTMGLLVGSAELLGANSSYIFPEMGFSIEKVTVSAKTRALKAEYTLELAQDLKAIHGLDAEAELSNILSGEILAEINREVVRSIIITAERGATEGTTTSGIFDLDTDSNGRWSVEKFKGLLFQIERECNKIAKETRRGKGNVIICSSDVASALQMAGVLDYAPALNTSSLNIDDTGNTFAGVISGRIKVYIDPYAGTNFLVVGYKGSNPFDAGLFYCPYVPLQMVRAVDPGSFQPKIGFKTRYGMAPNPFAKGTTAASTTAVLEQDSNKYYRRVLVNNLM